MRSPRTWRMLAQVAFYGVLLVGASVSVLPFLWTLSSSLKPTANILQYPPTLIPTEPTVGHYARLFGEFPFARWYANSAVLAISLTALSTLFCSAAGFGFAKYRFRFQWPLFSVVIGSLIIPFGVIVVPLFVLMHRIGWLDSYAALIVPFIAPPFGIFMMRQFMVQSIPDELLDAGRIDGASEYGLFWRLTLPLARPALGAFAVWQFMGAWNSFLWPLIVLKSEEKFTLSIGMAGLYQLLTTLRPEYGMLMAGSFLVALPMILVFIAMQRQFIAGLTVGAIKG